MFVGIPEHFTLLWVEGYFCHILVGILEISMINLNIYDKRHLITFKNFYRHIYNDQYIYLSLKSVCLDMNLKTSGIPSKGYHSRIFLLQYATLPIGWSTWLPYKRLFILSAA